MFEALAAPFPPDRVSWRVGSVKKDGGAAMALAYIDARDVMERLDAVCGPAGWQCRYTHADRKTICDVGIRIFTNGAPELDEHGGWKSSMPFEWVWKADGAGDSDIEAEKGALSDAFKRAAVRWGIGRYLYHLPSPWVEIDQYKKITATGEAKLRKLLESRGAPASSAQPPAPQASGRLSAFEAKRQGIGEGIRVFIQGATAKQLSLWMQEFDHNTAHVPLAWLEGIRDLCEGRLVELNNPSPPEVDEAANGLDEAYRQTVAA